jgi:CheY-like chemotaxis protein
MSTHPTVIVRRRGDRERPLAGPSEAREDAQALEPPDQSVTRRTILVIEDSPVHLKLLTRQLAAGLGCEVLAADGVESGIGTLLTRRPDLIVTDLMMPELDGMDLMAVLDTREQWRDIPIVIHSAVNDHKRVRSLRGGRVRDYLLKPFSPGIAIPRLRRILSGLPVIPPGVAAPPPAPRPHIPVLLACATAVLRDQLARAVARPYELVAVPSGPAALATTVELRPWTVFVTSDVAPWDAAKTVRAIGALKGAEKCHVVDIPRSEEGVAGAIKTLQRELAQPPFELYTEAGETTVVIRDTFTVSCLGALEQSVKDALAGDLERLVFDIPYQGLGRTSLTAIQELIRSFQG